MGRRRKNSDLLHDIICMANSKNNEDSYIIFEVEDKTYKILGVENTQDRKKSAECN